MSQMITVRVPATTANLGPGFDCIGAALTLYNTFRFTEALTTKITVTGADAERVATDADNLAYRSFLKLFDRIGQTPPVLRLEIDMAVPLARGLGSSATAIVGGLLGANQLAGSPLSQTELMELAIAMEGHPDNVVPALLGGCRLAASGLHEEPIICDVPWHDAFVPVLGIPDFELSTAAARQVLPMEYSRDEAIFNMAHLGLLVRALETGQSDWLQAALRDAIHQPYRQTLIKGFKAVQNAAVAAGAYGLVISGAGPTLLAIASPAAAPDTATAMAAAWTKAGVQSQVKVLSLDRQGAHYV